MRRDGRSGTRGTWGLAAIGALLALTWAPSASATDLVALGAELQVNAYTGGTQEQPAVALADTGEALVVWRDAGRNLVEGRALDGTGSPIGAAFGIAGSTAGSVEAPDVTAAPDGSFLVVWEGPDASGSGALVRRVDADGTLLGAEITVGDGTASEQSEPAVAVEPDGDFVVVWGGTSPGIAAQRFSSSGAALGSEITVEPWQEAESLEHPSVMADESEFVVVWWAGENCGFYCSVFAVDGRALPGGGPSDRGGSTFRLTEPFTLNDRPALAGSPDGPALAVWAGLTIPMEPAPLALEVRGRALTSAGADGPLERIDGSAALEIASPVVAALPDDEFVVLWAAAAQSTRGDVVPTSLRGRIVDEQGARASIELGLSSTFDADLGTRNPAPAVAADASGGVVVAWRQPLGESPLPRTVRARRYQRVPAIFQDGFEFGDLSAWAPPARAALR